mmetsp:Transcript_10284/g.20184  ORF Transcript_10284/g.20184 Transcript_10284/m.20184 type:complete len:663 (-) Transcript_10284:211-2199(-)|eukprot:CAMPEP_0171569572 /NCGR_PEP_ID=MMETSP0961-20121227/2426_1 /TAXON_ID=87120 /ORGANISM="Aurantiochytrium limacinum, Strain ATCCMYA-1381" /LENGTH=662 /DNA_ID=CAMNT_0012123891 /DNA_START=35 /DNA_END=2023 /DNA_ORIENTATION=+
MDPVIRLRKGEVVQMEGWLLKKRAGVDLEDEIEETEADASLDSMPASLTPSGSRLEALLLRRPERKRYFVLTTQPADKATGRAPRAMLFYCGRKPTYEREDETTRPSIAKMSVGSESDLRRLAKNNWIDETTKPQWNRGSIVLTDTTEISLLPKNEIKIVVPGKSIRIRPMERGTSAETKLLARQWFQTMQRTIKDLLMWETKQHSKSNFQSLHRTASQVEMQKCPESLEGVLASPTHRRHFAQFCDFRHGAENLTFYDKVEEFEAKIDAVVSASSRTSAMISSSKKLLRRLSQARVNKMPKDIRVLAREILNDFIVENAPQQVNLSNSARTEIVNAFKEEGDDAVTADLFTKAKQEIFLLMETNYFLRFYREEMRKTGCFSSLYGNHGLSGYEAVLGHFGLVKTDMQRLLDAYSLRMAQVEGEENALKSALRISHDVAVASQHTTRRALLTLYRSDGIRLQALDEFRRQLEESVVFPLTWLQKTIDLQVESIMDGDNEYMQRITEAKDNLEKARHKEQDLKVVAQYRDMEDLNHPEIDAILKQYSVELANIDEELTDAKQRIPMCEMAVTRTQQQLEDRMIESLDQLEALEIHRLEEQQRAVKHAINAEHHGFEVLQNHLSNARAAYLAMDAPADMLSFSKAFAASLDVDDAGSTATGQAL